MESKKRMTATRTIKHWATGPKLESSFAYFCFAIDCVGAAWSFVISHPNTTAMNSDFKGFPSHILSITFFVLS